MPFLRKLVLTLVRVGLGAAILVTFATIMGVGIGRQAALGGGFSDEAREALTERPLWVWLTSGGGRALAAVAVFALLERWLARRWTGK